MELSDERVVKLQEMGWRFGFDPKQGWILHDPVGEEFPDANGQSWDYLDYAVEAAEEAEERAKHATS